MTTQPLSPLPAHPRLRANLDIQPYTHEGQPMWLFVDPWQLSDKQLLLPPALAQLAVYLNGQRSLAEAQALLSRQAGFLLPDEVALDLLAALQGSFLLEDAPTAVAKQTRRAAFRAQPHRPPQIAGYGYPADPTNLRRELEAYGQGDDPAQLAEFGAWHGRAIVSPHIDYQRGGAVYAQVWQRAATAVAQADLILIFATDHRGGLGSLTLTPLPYATPYGVLPTDPALVQTLADTLGEEAAFAFELNHEQEHSVELVAVWLHHVLQAQGQEPPPVVPLLIGSFQHFVSRGGHPLQDEEMMGFVETLVEATRGRKVLCVASVDLAHVGPAFEDDFVMDEARRVALVETDERLITAVLRGDEEQFYNDIAAIQDANKVCGFSPLYLMLRYLRQRDETPLRGHKIAYQHCPADGQNHSLVSICGLLLE